MNNACFSTRGGSAARVDVSPTDGEPATIESNGNLQEWACGEGYLPCRTFLHLQPGVPQFSVKSEESDLDDAIIVESGSFQPSIGLCIFLEPS